jgi:Tfp pilus assembly PilM family ATPase
MSRLTSLREASTPSVAVEIASGRVSSASLEWRGQQPVIAAHASEAIPDAALVPSLTAANIHDRAAVVGALGRVLEQTGRPKRIGLVVPDVVAKVSLVKFEKVPARVQDLDQLVRWQVRKAAPFPIEEAQVTYVPGLSGSDGQEFIVSLARRTVVEEYEQLCAEAGAHAGIVDLATFNVVNAVVASTAAPQADWLLVNVAADYASIAILRGPHLIFFRNRAAETDGTLADLVHQTAMYYEDRLKGAGFARVLLAGAASGASQTGDIDEFRRSLQQHVTMTIDAVDWRAAAALTDRITAAPPLLDTLAPLVGMLLRDQGEVVNV